jgi:hypothetical protein
MTAVITTKRPNYVTGRTEISKRLNLRLVNLVLGGIVFLIGGYYLVNINDLTVKGFALRELKSESTILASENLDSEAKVMNLQSYGSLNEKVKKLNMVAVGEVEYLTVDPTVLARK